MGRADKAGEGGWCILRTSGARTLPLAKSLGDEGFEVWTPIEVQSRRLPRSKIKVERDAPIMPTFVFVRATRLRDIFRILSLPRSPHPSFSIFRHMGRIPIIADHEIESLRSEEKRAAPKARRRVFAAGERVRVPEGSFGGMSGAVVEGNGKFTIVCFGRKEVKIATWLLRTDLVQAERPQLDAAA